MDGKVKNDINRIYAITCLVTGAGEILVNLFFLVLSIMLDVVCIKAFFDGSLNGTGAAGLILAFYLAVFSFAFIVFTLIMLVWVLGSIIAFIWTLLYFTKKSQQFKRINIIVMAMAKVLVGVLYLVFVGLLVPVVLASETGMWLAVVGVLWLAIYCVLFVFSGFIFAINMIKEKDKTDKSDNLENVTISEDCK